MAPVAGGIADRKKNRLVLARRRFKRFIAPRIPIHRVVGVLQKIGTLFVRETVRHDENHDCSAGQRDVISYMSNA